MYYFDSNRVQEFVFREVIKKGAVLASEKNIILKNRINLSSERLAPTTFIGKRRTKL